MLEFPKSSPFLSLYFLCLENLIHAHGSNDLLEADVSQIYIFSLDHSSSSRPK